MPGRREHLALAHAGLEEILGGVHGGLGDDGGDLQAGDLVFGLDDLRLAEHRIAVDEPGLGQRLL